MSAYTHLLAGIGLSVESTAKILQTNNQDAYKDIQKLFGPLMKQSYYAISGFN